MLYACEFMCFMQCLQMSEEVPRPIELDLGVLINQYVGDGN